MKTFIAKTFNIAKLKGISEENVTEHLKLYAGYINNANTILKKIEELSQDPVKNAYELAEVQRRFGFEYDGIRNHENYFELLSNGAKDISKDGDLRKMIEDTWGSYDKWLARFKTVAMSRGVGWAILYFDKKENFLMNAYVGDHELGQLSGCAPIVCLDLWEHAYIADYSPGGKKDYVEDFFINLNWGAAEKFLKEAQ
ncbi:MAG: superoxide dismutase [Patescibacteria group bacterium]|nr:superoxide dismutase [Patescibacteria group bacterium]